MQIITLLVTLFVAFTFAVPLPTSPQTNECAIPRLRKEIRSLSTQELQDFVDALRTMDTLTMQQGQVLFGTAFRTIDAMVYQHAVAVQDFRGDQGHFGPHFMTFHRAFSLMYENSILAIKPNLSGLPYWDSALDSYKNGTYFNTSNYFFSPKFAGSVPGNAAYNFTVTDGLFPWRKIGHFNSTQFNGTMFNGTALNGLLRSYTSTISNPYMTRYPRAKDMNGASAEIEEESTHGVVSFSSEQYWNCTSLNVSPTWLKWQDCIESVHGVLHQTIGGVGNESDSTTGGDMQDVTTSPNDILVFPVHHTNMDRNNQHWQRKMYLSNATMATRTELFGYPQEYSLEGARRQDIINANAPFTDILLPWTIVPANGVAYTHEELLWHTSPGLQACPLYVYDDML
jgi:hypothetical protein